MSAYIVEKQTIDRIVTYLQTPDVRQHIDYHHPSLAGTAREQGQRLWGMNVQAVDARYEERNAVTLYRHSTALCSPVQTLKSIRCLLYQCSEGDVPETELWRALDTLSVDLAIEIVAGLPEWDAAQWG